MSHYVPAFEYAYICSDTEEKPGTIYNTEGFGESDQEILDFIKDEYDGEWYGNIKGLQAGTVHLYLYIYDYRQKKYTDLFAELGRVE